MVRVVTAEDSVILREGMVESLTTRGCEVLATAGDADEPIGAVASHLPDGGIVDIRMLPTFTDEGFRAAVRLRAEQPNVGILVFSQHAEPGCAARLLSGPPGSAPQSGRGRCRSWNRLRDGSTNGSVGASCPPSVR
ncbi:response regulator [Streptomyces sp. CB02923]|uniref:response regulator n=1 Tax=Streptomyces sp. CB02923 TaxID=1718985 RepID=UPI00093B8E07|nr:response regulator [Streptomyces sp. CB02923]